jgi:hypothetical protein
MMMDAPTLPLGKCTTAICVATLMASPANGAIAIVHCPFKI